jgi:hypothetical protein
MITRTILTRGLACVLFAAAVGACGSDAGHAGADAAAGAAAGSGGAPDASGVAGGIGGDGSAGQDGGGAGQGATADSGASDAGGQGVGCPSDSSSIFPTASCTGGMNCTGSIAICDCVASQWRNCRLTKCVTGGVPFPYGCDPDIIPAPNCVCRSTQSQTQLQPLCYCSDV